MVKIKLNQYPSSLAKHMGYVHIDIYPLGTIKTSQAVVLNEDMYLLLNENSCKQHNPNPQIEFDFVEKHIH